ncbi:MAG: hypothetical protein KJZ80_06110 [Hyphomicrobiaceae bacterium]|nr:hypothetical protein [Hyphomicrobiaceae bacterium]
MKTEYKYVMGYEFWHENPKDAFLDGAVRVSTSSFKSGRTLTVRCFKPSADSAMAGSDLRYVIDAPLLKKVVPELEKAGNIELVVSIDGVVVASILKVRPIAHDFGISFLGEIKPDLLERIGSAEKSVVVMPRQGSNKLDDMIEFGVAELAKHIEPVRRACATAGNVPLPDQSKKT